MPWQQTVYYQWAKCAFFASSTNAQSTLINVYVKARSFWKLRRFTLQIDLNVCVWRAHRENPFSFTYCWCIVTYVHVSVELFSSIFAYGLYNTLNHWALSTAARCAQFPQIPSKWLEFRRFQLKMIIRRFVGTHASSFTVPSRNDLHTMLKSEIIGRISI